MFARRRSNPNFVALLGHDRRDYMKHVDFLRLLPLHSSQIRADDLRLSIWTKDWNRPMIDDLGADGEGVLRAHYEHKHALS